MSRIRHIESHTEYDSEWDELEEMLEKWIVAANLNFEQRQSLIPIRDFIYEQTSEGE